MFATRQICRTLHTSLNLLARRQRPRKSNPGMAYQIEGLDLNKEDEVVHDIGDLESNFMQVHKTHREYEREQEKQRERLRRLIIKQKYFRDPILPNMLTYAEKEQIRFLHERNPEEWPIERLAESFPATMDIIQKVLRSKWRARTVKRVKAHDETVAKNWEQLRTDKEFAEQFPTEFFEHLKKFSARTAEDIRGTTKHFKPPAPLPTPQRNEFLSIITSCDKYKEQPPQLESSEAQAEIRETPKPISNENLDAETYLFDKIVDKRPMRLDDLKSKKFQAQLTIAGEGKSNIEENSKAEVDKSLDMLSGNFLQKYKESEITISKEDADRYDMKPFKTHIYIPRKLRKKDAIYRVKDSFYADDGEFLFSVPGMTGKFT